MKSQGKSSGSTGGDDRNLVAVDQNYSEADFSDKLFLFWENYKNLIIAGIVALFVIALGTAVVRTIAANRDAGIRAEYQATEQTPAALATFAQANSRHSLGGVAAVQAGNISYEQGEFDAAAEHYQFAVSNGKQREIVARGIIGLGMSEHARGNTEQAISGLKSLLNDGRQIESFRGEAGFYLSTIFAETGDLDQIDLVISRMQGFEMESTWLAIVEDIRGVVATLQ